MANLRYIKIDPTTGKKVVVSLKDVSPYWIYDTKTIQTDDKTVSYFSNIQNNDEIATDMLQPNVLPNGWKFVLFAIRFIPDFNASADDVAKLTFNSVIAFVKEGTEIFKAPTFVFNAGAGIFGSTNPTNGYPSTQAVYTLPLQLQIEGNQPFSFDLTKSITLENPVTAKLQLDGIVYRNIVGA